MPSSGELVYVSARYGSKKTGYSSSRLNALECSPLKLNVEASLIMTFSEDINQFTVTRATRCAAIELGCYRALEADSCQAESSQKNHLNAKKVCFEELFRFEQKS